MHILIIGDIETIADTYTNGVYLMILKIDWLNGLLIFNYYRSYHVYLCKLYN